ncbi:hypothetical protein PUR71_08755, partial [Streptomyces sp. SP17BM10]|nr:hypothetical protein [Streptomyces sp. SP17BM10]
PVLAANFDHGVVVEHNLLIDLILVVSAGHPAHLHFRVHGCTKHDNEHNADRGSPRLLYSRQAHDVADLHAALADPHPEHDCPHRQNVPDTPEE